MNMMHKKRNTYNLLLKQITRSYIVAPIITCCLLFVAFHTTIASDIASNYSVHSEEINDTNVAEILGNQRRELKRMKSPMYQFQGRCMFRERGILETIRCADEQRQAQGYQGHRKIFGFPQSLTICLSNQGHPRQEVGAS